MEADRLGQVAGNLIDNALKHGAAGGCVEVCLRTLDARFVVLSIEDDGPGVPASEREAIFALGYRSAAGRAGGTGIGLAVARLIVERIGGEIDVAGGRLGGACFRIRLPRAEEEEPGASAGAGDELACFDEREVSGCQEHVGSPSFKAAKESLA